MQEEFQFRLEIVLLKEEGEVNFVVDPPMGVAKLIMSEVEVEPHATAAAKAKKHTQFGQEIESRIGPPKCEGWSFTEASCQAQLPDKNAQPVSQNCLTTIGQVGNVGVNRK